MNAEQRKEDGGHPADELEGDPVEEDGPPGGVEGALEVREAAKWETPGTGCVMTMCTQAAENWMRVREARREGGEEGGDGVEEEADVLGEELDEDGGYEVLYELEEEQDSFYCLWCQSLVF